MTSVKNSDIHWLGKVASDWEIAPAWRVMKERGEKSLPDDVHLTPSQTHGVLTQQDYMDRTGNKVVLNLAGADNMKRVRAGDFIIHLRSFEGGIEASAIDGKVSNAYTVLTPAPDTHFGYYRWFMKSVPLIEGLASSTDQLRDGQSINFSRFSRLSLPLPPLETQRRIADYLDRETAEIDAAVVDLDKYVELLEKRRQVVITQSVTRGIGSNRTRVHLRALPGSEGVMNSPTKKVPFWSLLEFINAPVESSSYGVRLEDIDSWTGRLFDNVICDRRDSQGTPFQPGDSLFGKLRPYLAKSWLATTSGVAVGDIHVYRPKPHCEPRFLSYILRTSDFISFAEGASEGVKMPRSEWSKLRQYPIPLPPLETQQRIADYLDRETTEIDSLISESTRLRDLLLKRRSVLITEVVTGRKQV